VTHNERGGFRFLGAPGLPFSSGVVADEGFDIARVVLQPMVPLERGFAIVRQYLEEAGRPIQALSGMELRIPAPLPREGFEEFNRAYIDVLDSWDLRVEGMLPPARTNVAPADGSISEPSVFAFSFAAHEPALPGAFLMAGAPEAEEMATGAEAGLRSIVSVLSKRMESLGVRWDRATAANFYAAEDWAEEVSSILLPAFGDASRTVQLTWVAALPPVVPYQFEVDVRRCGKELTVATGAGF
jgi:hypothetical protein